MKKEITEITFEDGTKGTITTETIKGRVDVKAEYAGVRVYYYTEHVNSKWCVKKCNDGRCYDTVIIAKKATRKEAVSEIILDVRKNQVRSANTYIFETNSGRMFEVVATSENLAKKCVRIDEKNLYTKEIKKADEIKQQKAKIGEYADFINEYLPTPSDEPKTEDEEEAAAEHFVKQMSEPEPDVNTMIIKQNLNSYYGMTVNQKSEYMGIDYTDARRFNNWQKLLIEKLYDGNTEHDKIYCNTIHDAKKIYDDVRQDGKYVYFYSIWNGGVELYVEDAKNGVLHYVTDFENMNDCEKYIEVKHKFA